MSRQAQLKTENDFSEQIKVLLRNRDGRVIEDLLHKLMEETAAVFSDEVKHLTFAEAART